MCMKKKMSKFVIIFLGCLLLLLMLVIVDVKRRINDLETVLLDTMTFDDFERYVDKTSA